MLYLSFFGEQRVPAEAGHHAHESPRVMTWPLIILALFAAAVGMWLDRSYLNGTHPFASLLASTPSLTGAVAQTERLGEFHASVAATSLVIALAGMLLATYLYVVRRSSLSRWQAWMELRPLHQITNGEHLVRLRQRPGWRSVENTMRSMGLGWLVRLVVDAVRLVALALLAALDAQSLCVAVPTLVRQVLLRRGVSEVDRGTDASGGAPVSVVGRLGCGRTGEHGGPRAAVAGGPFVRCRRD